MTANSTTAAKLPIGHRATIFLHNYWEKFMLVLVSQLPRNSEHSHSEEYLAREAAPQHKRKPEITS